MRKRTLISLLVVLLVIGVGAAVLAADLNPTPEKPVTLRLGYADNPTWPEGKAKVPEPEHAMALIFKQYVESNTNGAVKIQLFPSSQLGSPKEMTEMCKTGAIDLAIETGVLGSFFPKFQVINLPFVFKSDEVAWWLFDNSQYWKDLMAEMEETVGLTFLGMGQNGVRNFTNNVRPIRTPADMKGLKFRVMESPIYVKMIESMGARAIPIAWSEVYTSLQTGVVDGEENPLAIIAFVGKLYEVQKYLTLDGHIWSEDMLVMNTRKFKSFPEDIQHILKIAGMHSAYADRASEAFLTRILAYDLLAEEMEIYKPTAEELQMFIDTARPPVVEWLKGEIGAEAVEEFLAAVKEAEEALGY